MPFERDLLGINERVLFEEIYQLARTPGPCAERAPVVDLARLTFIDETDDSLAQLVVVTAVALDAARIEIAVSPAEGDGRLLPGRGSAPRAAAPAAPLDDHRHFSGCVR